jgi:hypothetical protein
MWQARTCSPLVLLLMIAAQKLRHAAHRLRPVAEGNPQNHHILRDASTLADPSQLHVAVVDLPGVRPATCELFPDINRIFWGSQPGTRCADGLSVGGMSNTDTGSTHSSVTRLRRSCLTSRGRSVFLTLKRLRFTRLRCRLLHSASRRRCGSASCPSACAAARAATSSAATTSTLCESDSNRRDDQRRTE